MRGFLMHASPGGAGPGAPGATSTGRCRLNAKSVEFTEGASGAAQLPRSNRPEIALAGRSNVGKSSLLNRLVGRSGIARVSKTPGRTQQINFFLVNDAWYLVDLPGYGFARVPLRVRDGWRSLVEAYLGRSMLRGAVVIVDLRRGLQADDEQLLDFLHQRGVPVCVAATKADKVSRGHRRWYIDAVRDARADLDIVVCSAATGEGVGDLGAVMQSWLDAT